MRAPLILTLAVACFFAGIRFERERQRRDDEPPAEAAIWNEADRLTRALTQKAAELKELGRIDEALRSEIAKRRLED
jgi:hypothetical protein